MDLSSVKLVAELEKTNPIFYSQKHREGKSLYLSFFSLLERHMTKNVFKVEVRVAVQIKWRCINRNLQVCKKKKKNPHIIIFFVCVLKLGMTLDLDLKQPLYTSRTLVDTSKPVLCISTDGRSLSCLKTQQILKTNPQNIKKNIIPQQRDAPKGASIVFFKCYTNVRNESGQGGTTVVTSRFSKYVTSISPYKK